MCKCNIDYNKDSELSFYRKSLTRVLTIISVSLIIAIILLFTSNIIWLCEWCQYDYVEIEAEDGNANYIGNDGVIIGGDN